MRRITPPLELILPARDVRIVIGDEIGHHEAPADFYSPAEHDVFRLSSKSHWDIPLIVRGKVVHFLVSHPTPPVFDGPEDRNGLRDADERPAIAPYRHVPVPDVRSPAGGARPGGQEVMSLRLKSPTALALNRHDQRA